DKRGKQRWAVWALRILILFATYYGTIKTAELAWTIGDIGVGLMAWLNLIAIFLLRKPALKALKDYRRQKAEGKDPVFNADEWDIKHADEWSKRKDAEPIFVCPSYDFVSYTYLWPRPEKIIIVDFGSQSTQLIARRVRELNVYCEIYPYSHHPAFDTSVKGVIFSGSPYPVRQDDAPQIDFKPIQD